MEIKSATKLKDVSGREITVHLSEAEYIELLQAGFHFLLSQGFITYKDYEAQMVDDNTVIVHAEGHA